MDKDRQEFEKWKASLPKCIGYEGGCDGSLEGLSHEEDCPMFGKEFATHYDAFNAGWKSHGSSDRAKGFKAARDQADDQLCRVYGHLLTKKATGKYSPEVVAHFEYAMRKLNEACLVIRSMTDQGEDNV